MLRSLAPFVLCMLTAVNISAIEPKPSQVPVVSNQVATFTGFSLGLNAGFLHAAANTSWINYIPYPLLYGAGGQYATTAKGETIGVHAILGRVYPSQFYFGGELSASVSSAKGRTFDNINFGLNYYYSIKDYYTATVRAGIQCDKTLLYVKAGLALFGREVAARFANSSTYRSAFQVSRKYNLAPTAGMGFDVAMQSRLSCGLEASYAQYRSDKFVYPGAATYNMKVDIYDFKIKLTYKI